MSNVVAAVGADELLTLRRLAIEGGLVGETKVSCSGLADTLDVSTQTVSRRLRRLEDAGLLARDTVADGQWVQLTDAGERALREEYRAYRRVFEGDETVTLRGAVTGGMGEGRHYISLPGYMEQFRERLGYEPFAGTLNVDLDAESVRARAGLAALDPIRIDGWEDEDRTYGPAFCYPATVEAPDGTVHDVAHVIAPERTHHGEDQLEVIAPVKLRERLGLVDDDAIVVRVTAPPTDGEGA